MDEREVYVKKLFAGMDQLQSLQDSVNSSKAAVIDDLLDRAWSMTDSAIDMQVFNVNVLQNLKAMCQEVSTACTLMQPELSTDTPISATIIAPQLPASMPHTVNAMAPDVREPLIPPVQAAMILEGRYVCNFEFDTGASNSVIPFSVYEAAYLVAHPQHKPERGPAGTMILADGSATQSTSFRTYISMAKADKPSNARTFEVMVCDGASTLLGRDAIKYFWPKFWNHLRSITGTTQKAASSLQPTPIDMLDSAGASSIGTDTQSAHVTPTPALHATPT